MAETFDIEISELIDELTVNDDANGQVNVQMNVQGDGVNVHLCSPLPKTNDEAAALFGVSVRCIQKWATAVKQADIILRDNAGFTEEAVRAFEEIKDVGISQFLKIRGFLGDSAKPVAVEVVETLDLPKAALVPIAGTDKLTLARHELKSNQDELQNKLISIQNKLRSHQQQQAASQESFKLNLKNRKARMLMKVAEAAIEDKLEADQLYDAIVSGELNLNNSDLEQ
jgi:hypothetical protein